MVQSVTPTTGRKGSVGIKKLGSKLATYHVALVSNEDHLSVIPRIRFDLCTPERDIDSFCLYRTRHVVKWRHLVVTFSVEEFSSISQIKSFLLQCSELGSFS